MTLGPFRAVLFDFGGVVADSPFDNFARYERDNDIPADFIRQVNSTNPDNNAWAKIERQEITPDEFNERFAKESAALGHRIAGHVVLDMLQVDVRPAMVDLVERIKEAGYVTACLTNNIAKANMDSATNPKMQMFDYLIESSVVGCRKPEPRFYKIACKTIGVESRQCIFLDDLGINLKPARAMGMTTIKVLNGDQGICALTKILTDL